MRILSRPMFKYGGPIKEGVMSGMKNGGSMGNHEGPRRAALVGDPVFPKDSSGRAHHLVPVAYGIGAGLLHGARMALPWAARMLARPFAKKVIKQIPKLTKVKWRPGGSIYSKGYPGGTTQGSWQRGATISGPQKVWEPTKFGRWFQADPTYKSIAAGSGMFGKGVKYGGQKIGEFAKYSTTTPSGLLFFGAPVTIAAGKWLLSDGTELNEEQKNQVKQVPQEGPPGGGDPGMQGTGEWFAAEAQKKLAEKNKAARKAKLAKYMDTMGYDRAQKTAIGKALVDASAIVQAGTEEGGSLKHADWSKMINQAIQSTSKRLEKPEQIREAVGLMLTKSEIEKDLEDPSIKKLRLLQIEQGEKALEEGFEKDMRDLFLSSKVAPDKKTVERYARYTADKYGHDFTKVTDEQLKNAAGKTEQEKLVNVVGDDGVYLIGDAIIKVTDGVPKLFG